jgi:hypothetical protein
VQRGALVPLPLDVEPEAHCRETLHIACARVERARQPIETAPFLALAQMFLPVRVWPNVAILQECIPMKRSLIAATALAGLLAAAPIAADASVMVFRREC